MIDTVFRTLLVISIAFTLVTWSKRGSSKVIVATKDGMFNQQVTFWLFAN